jgi:polysaccharide deacetylase 2 family uncharacterized protein YibQ
MPARAWAVCLGLILVLLVAVVGLDAWQARQGEPSILGIRWGRGGEGEPPDPGRRGPLGSAPREPGVARLAVIVEGFGGRQDLVDQVAGIDRALTIAVLPELPLSARTAREAARAGFEVLVQIPLEPYRYPELDPGPGTLLVKMSPQEVRSRVTRYLSAIPYAVGVTGHMGSRLVEDPARVRAMLEPVRARRLVFVDHVASSLSVAGDSARALGIPSARRHVRVDHRDGEAVARARFEAAGDAAERRGEAVVVVSGHPLTIGLLREYIRRWEARGIRLVRISRLAR